MASRTGDYKVPFDRAGNQLHYASQWGRDVVWVDNFKFAGRLKIDSMRTGRSAKYTVWHAPDGTQYTMFVTDLLEMLRKCTSQNGSVVGSWTFVKRGQNFGVRYLG